MTANQLGHVSHTFVAATVPTERDIHCWHAHQTDKDLLDSKIIRNGRVIQLVCRAGEIQPKSIELAQNSFDFKRTMPVEAYDASLGDLVTISTRLCYVVKIRPGDDRPTPGVKKRYKTATPVDLMGKIKPHLKKTFFNYLENATGLADLAKNAEVGIVVETAATQEEKMRNKVWFDGAINLVIRAKVANAEVFNRLAHVSIGNRRSYGFGSVSCDLIERAAMKREHEESMTL